MINCFKSVVPEKELLALTFRPPISLSMSHPITPTAGVPFAWTATVRNHTTAPQELVMTLVYPPILPPNSDAPELTDPLPITTPFMLSGSQKTEVFLRPESAKNLYWTVVATCPGAHSIPTVLLHSKRPLQCKMPLWASSHVPPAQSYFTSPLSHVVVFPNEKGS